jgi:hypothetical protein
VRWEYGLYALGLSTAIAGATSTFATGWYAVSVMALGLGVFVLGIVVEERRYAATPT